jgi:hypothetical protein
MLRVRRIVKADGRQPRTLEHFTLEKADIMGLAGR